MIDKTLVNLQNMIFNAIPRVKLILILLLITLGSAAQKNTGLFHISGRIRVDNGDPTGAVVTLNNLSAKTTENTVTLNSSGKFELDLKYANEFKMTVVKDGHYTKDIDISTIIPSNVWAKDSVFPAYLMVVTIYKKVPDVTLSFEGKTIGKIVYSPNGKLDNFDADIFISDKDIRREIDQALKDKDDEIFNKKMAEAVEFEKKNQIREALKAYEEALALRKNDQFIKPKIKELNSDLKNLEKDAQNEAQFQKLLAAGDENVAQIKYPEAIDNFKAALSLKPGDQVGSAKLTNAEQLLAKQNAEKDKLEAQFNQLLASGDQNITVQKYPEAIDNFKAALNIKPGDKTATSKLANAEQLLARVNADKAKLEAEFNRLLALGDEQVSGKKYPEAIENFKGALSIRNGDKIATDKLSNAEKLLAAVKAGRAAQDAEFNRLLAAGDANVTGKKYPDAIDNFKAALGIKPGDKVATDKLANAEQLLAGANAEKSRLEAEFNRLLAAGDENITGKMYPEAIQNFKNALKIKPADKIATEKLSNAEQLLAALNADKARQEAEFVRLLAAGDQNVSVQKYPEAIDNFKAALNIKPGDKSATAKLANAEKLLAALNVNKARQEAEFNRLLAVGDENVTASKYPEAIQNFIAALTLKTGDKTATDKLANAEKLLAQATANKAKQEAEFNRLMATGDENVSGKKFPEAIENFKDALKIEEGDRIATAKLANAEKLLAAANAARAGIEAEFSRLLLAGDENVSNKKFFEAIENFKQALAIKAGDKVATDKLANAEKLLAQVNADKAKQDAEFDRLITAGDNNVTGQKYADAISSFKSALLIKPGNSIAESKLSVAEQLFAKQSAERSKQDSEFNNFLTLGDGNILKQKYEEAINNYTVALRIKPLDSGAAAKLANAEKLLANFNAEKSKQQAEFNRLISAGDDNVSSKKYLEAIANFKGALTIIPEEKSAMAKLSNAEKLLAQANADKAKQEAEFNRLLASGDENVLRRKYPEAIDNFKGALSIKEGDPIATTKLANAQKLRDQVVADMAKLEEEFNRLLGAGDMNVAGQKYPEGIVNFKDALKIKPVDPVALKKLAEAEKLLAQFNADKLKKEAELRLLADKQKRYKETIVMADQLFADKSWLDSKNQYREAIRISDVEKYPKDRIVQIDSIMAKIARDKLLTEKQANEQRKLQGEDTYQKNILAADANFAKSLWSSAIFYYREALKYKAADKYALDKIDNCNKMIDSNISAERIQEFNSYVQHADDDMKAKQYGSARFYYGKAKNILPWENYPKDQLKVLEKLISSTDVNGIESQYFDAIQKADDAVTQKNIAIARFYYQKAVSLKPNEDYPKQQLKRLSSEK